VSDIVRGSILGSPVSHSLSPVLHREAFDFLGIDGEYLRNEVQLGSFSTFFEAYKDEFQYFSITMPLKEEALTLPVILDPLVSRIQSANTLYRRGEDWHLTSTDGSGFISALKHEGHHTFNRALVLGAGGTARAVVGALDGVAEEISVLGRTSTRREVLEAAVHTSSFEYIRWNENPNFSEYDLVVNTTPAGAADLLADSLSIGSCNLLFDVIYKPWPTVLAARWADCGGKVINGLELLLYQGIQQLSLTLDRELDELALSTHIRPILRKAVR
jgi:shikimate dehydrogenase